MGLLDADVFGPSIPTMMNLDESPQLDDEDFMLPLNNFGVKVRTWEREKSASSTDGMIL